MHDSTLTAVSVDPSRSKVAIFPLPLVTFEQMLLTDDRPEYPMVSCNELVFSGRIDREAFRHAVDASVARHPLLNAMIGRTWRGKEVWVHHDQPPEIDWAALDEPVSGLQDYVDLRHHAAAKFWVREGDNETRILFRLHHACCDGFGSLQLMEDLFAAYITKRTGREEVGWRELRPELLCRRGDFRKLNQPIAQPSAPRVTMRDVIRFMRRRPSPIAIPQPACQLSRSSFDGRVFLDLGPDVLRGLRHVAASLSATLNDVLVSDLFMTLRDWNRHHAPHCSSKWLRIMMPRNLRDAEFQSMPAANRIGYEFFTRSMDECGRPEELRQSVRLESEHIREQHRYLMWLRGLEMTRLSQFGLPWMIRSNRCFCTAILSNLGDPMRAFFPEVLRQRGKLDLGGLVLERMIAHTPVRPNTLAGFLATTYAGRLIISATCDPHWFSAESAEKLLKTYGKQLQSTAGVL